MVADGLTGFTAVVVNVLFVYQMGVPVTQVAESVELCPEQIVAGLADTAGGAKGVEFTVRVIFPEALLQPKLLTHAT